MTLTELRRDIQESLKKGDSVRVATLRFLMSHIRNLAIAKYGADGESKLTDVDITEIIKKQVKTHKESIEAFTKGNRPDLAEKEQAELTILMSFLPAEMSDADLTTLLLPVFHEHAALPFGQLMGKAMATVAGKADGGRVSTVLKSLLVQKSS